MTALPHQSNRVWNRLKLAKPSRRSRCRGWICVALASVSFGAVASQSPTLAGFPEAIERSGRFCGCGYGDGYHTCFSSGMRPLANLPPRTYPSRIGSMDEKINGCPQCGEMCAPGVDPIRSPAPDTFYHRFDQYARSVSHQRMQSERAASPFQQLTDPEQNIARGYSALDPQGNDREYRSSSPRHSTTGNQPTLAHPNSARLDSNVQDVDAPLMTEEEMAEYREYLEQKRLREKFDKYLIDPANTEPKQVFGGPPVGTEKRRQIDEDKVRQIQERLRRELANEAEAARKAKLQTDSLVPQTRSNSRDNALGFEDALRSSSDRRSGNRSAPSVLDDFRDDYGGMQPDAPERSMGDRNAIGTIDAMGVDDELPVPLDELLPPFPVESLPESIPSPFGESIRDSIPESIPSGREEPLRRFNSLKPQPTAQTRRWIRQPHPATSRLAQDRISQQRITQPPVSDDRAMSASATPADSAEPVHQIATLPDKNLIPESWHFVKQPE